MSHIFLSYAHTDFDAALELYDEITAAGYPVWLDKKVLLVGQNWKEEITRAIRDASAFIALISENSVDHQGYIQKELRQGIDVLEQTPSNQIYILPVRISDVRPVEEQLQNLHWLDMFPDPTNSLTKLLEAIATVPGLLPVSPSDETMPQLDEAATKFESIADVFRIILERVPPTTPQSGPNNAFRVKFRTTEDGVDLPASLLKKYPREITVVLEHQYKDLVCDDTSFSVSLWFSGDKTQITVPYTAIIEMIEPEAHIRIT